MPGNRHTKRPDSIRQNRNRGRDTGRGTEQRKAGIQCRGIDIRKGRHPMPGKRRKKAAEYRGEQNKETHGIPRGTEQKTTRNTAGNRRKEILWKLSYQHNVSRLPAHSEKDTDIISVEHRVKTDPSVSTHSDQNGMCLETDT